MRRQSIAPGQGCPRRCAQPPDLRPPPAPVHEAALPSRTTKSRYHRTTAFDSPRAIVRPSTSRAVRSHVSSTNCKSWVATRNVRPARRSSANLLRHLLLKCSAPTAVTSFPRRRSSPRPAPRCIPPPRIGPISISRSRQRACAGCTSAATQRRRPAGAHSETSPRWTGRWPGPLIGADAARRSDNARAAHRRRRRRRTPAVDPVRLEVATENVREQGTSMRQTIGDGV
jgi:hypothetical protein